MSEQNQNQNQNKIDISQIDIVFVSDMFLQDYAGGAELTTEALIISSPFNVLRMHTSAITNEVMSQLSEKHWVFGNMAQLDSEMIPSIVANLTYSILEYDYKYCVHRSPEKHEHSENTPCDCEHNIHGKMISAFYYGATSMWWMSEAQQSRYFKLFPFLRENVSVVLSSVFDDKFFLDVKLLNSLNGDKERSGWIVLGSNSWIKGADDAEQWCKDNDKEYEVVWDLPYQTVLQKLSTAEGFVYLPKGGDTCPRMVIEAKLLGCKLHLNDNVQHAGEIWFDTDDEFDTLAYLFAARERFWDGIKYDMQYEPEISGYTTTLNCMRQSYPFIESIQSLLGFCNEVIIVDGGSDDGTWEALQGLANSDDRVKIHREDRDWDHKRFAVFDGAQKALARSLCTGKFCWQQDSDEVVHEEDYASVKRLVKNFPAGVELLALPVIEYWGGPEKIRLDVNPWKWRLSRNAPHITHGIPADLRKFDSAGELYSLPGSDGCDYVRSDNFERIPFANFMTSDVNNARVASLTDSNALSQYEDWFNQVINAIPGVHHYSWFNIDRKIKTYKNYWSKHWQSLYNITQEDTVENNMFFDKRWVDISDKDITEMASKLSTELGGWVFHSKVDFAKPTPHLKIDRIQPSVMKDWVKNNQ